MDSVYKTKASNSFYQGLLDDGETPEEAKLLTKQLDEILDKDFKEIRRQRRSVLYSKIFSALPTVGIVVFVLACLGAFSYAMYGVASHSDKDYAGFGPTKVAKHAIAAMHMYYGDSEMPDDPVVTSQKHGRYLGRNVWWVQVASTKKDACVIVWDDSKANNPYVGAVYKVFPGGWCGTLQS